MAKPKTEQTDEEKAAARLAAEGNDPHNHAPSFEETERLAAEEAARRNDPKTQQPEKVPAVPRIGGAITAPVKPVELMKDGDKGVLMVFPKAVRLTLQDHRLVEFAPGTRRVPTFLAKDPKTGEMHWYLKANGVTVLEEDK